MRKALAVIGAGPKAVAIAAKAFALRSLGYSVPDIVIFEEHRIGAHWYGGHGYTDGQRYLCTSPEKDIGFPYRSSYGAAVDRFMRRYSWHDFKVFEGNYGVWIDESEERRRPRHRAWTTYLQWVVKEIDSNIVRGRVTRVAAADGHWTVQYEEPGGSNATARADGVVLTGPGEARRLDIQDASDRITDGRSFWRAANLALVKQVSKGRIAIIGAGETAGTILCLLLDWFEMQPDVKLHFYNRGLPIARADGGWADKYFSDPTDWRSVSRDDRYAFIQHTDRGRIAETTHTRLDRAFRDNQFTMMNGTVRAASVEQSGLVLVSGKSSNGTPFSSTYDHVIVAKGFDPVSTLRPVWPKPPQWHGRTRARAERLAAAVDTDLSIRGMLPKLHVPMFAAVEQGPGLPRLHCLGAMSDLILQSYTKAPQLDEIRPAAISVDANS